MVARLIAQFLIDHQLPFVCFDTDRSHGALLRFYADYASPVLIDRYEALDHIIEAAVEQPGARVVVDLAAQTHEPLVQWMEESGVLDMAETADFSLHYWHVMDSVAIRSTCWHACSTGLARACIMSWCLTSCAAATSHNSRNPVSLNEPRPWATGHMIKRLHESVVQKIDTYNVSFWAARNPSAGTDASLGLMERQRLKM